MGISYFYKMKRFILYIACLLFTVPASATHILGAEIGYKHIGGLQYEVLVNIYGDCSGSAFGSLDTFSIAQVTVYNGSSAFATLNCLPYGDFGKEITPVCDADSNNTTCKSASGIIPGIAEFKYKATVTLNQTSPNWRFAFAGNLGGNNGAGRSNLISNIQIGAAGSLVYLEATLNNVNSPNNSPDLTTIPTPFFCLNQSQEYNTGAVDADGDSLNFEMVNGLEPTTNGGTSAVYLAGFSGAQPLIASSYNFSNQNGQLSFVPSQTQTSLVVNKISEYKNGVLVGSMMREMNFIVIASCNNQSPAGAFTNTTAGDIKTSTVIDICNADSLFNFSIVAQDPDSGNVSAVVTGLPPGLSYVVNGNNTRNPSIVFTYKIPTPIIPGSNSTFFVTFQDDGCPLSSKQQIAYTLNVIQPITFTTTILPEGCFPGGDGIVNLAGSSTNSGNLQYSFNGSPYTSLNTFGGLPTGIYPISIRDDRGCTIYNNVFVDTALKIEIDTITQTDVTCFERKDGSIQLSTVPVVANTIYTAIPTFQTSNNGTFNFLGAGTYTIVATTPAGCADTGAITIDGPPAVQFTAATVTDNRCEKGTGRIDIESNISNPAIYSISPNQQSNSTGSFGGLSAGFYKITVLDSNGCYKDTLVEVGNEPNNFSLQLSKQDVTCESAGNNGLAQVVATGGVEPYTYFWDSDRGTEGTQATISNLRSGLKRVLVTDAIGCQLSDYIVVNPANCCERVFIPSGFSPNGDGQNDIFRLRSPLAMTDVKFIVVNRWGQVVWRTDNQLDGWDGTYGEGNNADIGTYQYFLKYKCAGDADDKYYTLKGDITLLR